MPDGSIMFSTELDNKTLEKQLSSLSKKISSAEDKINQKQAERSPLVEQANQLAVYLDSAKAQLEYMKSGSKYFSTTEIKEQAETVRVMQKDWNTMQGRVERYDAAIRAAGIALDRNKAKAGAVAQKLSQASRASERMRAAIGQANIFMTKLVGRFIMLAKQALVFYVITRALIAIREWLGKVIKSSPEAAAAIGKLKAALLTLAQPFVDIIIPAFVNFVDVLATVITQLAKIVSFIFGTSLEKSKQSAEALNDQTKELEKTGKAAKKAGGQLAAFDELNTLTKDDQTADNTNPLDEIAPDFSGLQEFNSEEYKKKLDEITLYASSSLLALGIILTFSGANIMLGLGLIAAGAIGLTYSVKENWNLIVEKMQGPLGSIVAIIGGAFLVLGTILAFSGAAIPLGIALMVTGAAALASDAALNWDTVVTDIQGPVGTITAIMGGALLVIGALLTFSGAAIPLGIALMIIGATALATTAVLNWDKVKNAMQGTIGGIAALVGGALLVIGAVLAFTGAALPLGIGLMVVGAATLGSAAVLNWNTITEKLKGPIGAIVSAVSTALLAVGIILTVTGVSLPLGIALIAAGATGLATVTTLNWNTITDKLKGPIGAIVAAVSAALLAIGIILAITGVALPLGIALIAAGAVGLVSVIALNWNSIVDSIQGPIGKIVAIVGGALLVLGILLVLTGVGIPLGIALILAGAAALVTVTAINWNAILDKIKEIWGGIKNWWNTNVAPKFTLKYWQDKFSSIKEGLVSTIKNAVNGGISLFNKFIDWINDKLNISWDSFSLFGNEIIPAGSFQLLTLPKIPMLAEGAVIPPNREFMAVLGDQKSGQNIEAPESLIRKIFREEIGNGDAGGDIVIDNKLELDGEVIYRNQQKVARRRGKKLVEGNI